MDWRRAGDLGLWAGLAFLVVAESGVRGDPYWMQAGCLGILAAAVAVRRKRPLLALGVVLVPVSVLLAVTINTDTGVPVALIPAVILFGYLAGRREAALRPFAVLVGVSLVLQLAIRSAWFPRTMLADVVLGWLLVVLMALVLVVMPWLIGRYRAQRSLLATAGWERAERVEREQELRIAQVRLRERSRIAEDMHDAVGHDLSLIALRAAALEVDAQLSGRHRRAATELREAAAGATERLGEIVGVLRDSEAEAPTTPNDETVRDLVDRAAASGLAVHLVEDDAGDLPPMVDRAIHRVVQESLTNASKYAPGATVEVAVRRDADDVVVRVTDRGAEPVVVDGVPSSGTGLAGLTERVRLVGGTLTAGRQATGFQVVARLPRTPNQPAYAAPTVTSAVADEQADVRRRARRGLISAVAVPLVLGAAVGMVALGYYVVVSSASVLPPERFDRLTVGQPAAEVERQLPRMQMVDPPSERAVPHAGWDCRFYRPGGPFAITYAQRLCFADGRLVAKERVRTGAVTAPEEGAR